MHSLTLQQWILEVCLPLVYAIIGTSGGKILSQDGFSREVNAAIAWFVVLACAVATAYASNQLIGDPYGIISTIVGLISLLISGALSSLRPYLTYLDFLEQRIFTIVRSAPQPSQIPSVDPPVERTTPLPGTNKNTAQQ